MGASGKSGTGRTDGGERHPLRLFLRSIATIGASQVIAKVMMVAFVVVVARALTTSDYGYVQASIAVGGIASFVVTSGYPTALMRSLGTATGTGPEARMRRDSYFSTSVAIIVPLFAASAAVTLATGRLDAGVALVMFYSMLSALYVGLVSGNLETWKLPAFQALYGGLRLAVVVILLAYSGGITPLLVLVAYGLSDVLAIAMIEILRPSPVRFSLASANRPAAVELSRLAAPIIIATAGYSVMQSADILIIESRLGLEAVGSYAAAKSLVVVFGFIPQAVGIFVTPRLAGMDDPQEAERYYRLSLGFTVATSAALFLGFVALGERFLVLLFTDRYAAGASALFTLALGAWVAAVGWVFASLWVSRGNAWMHCWGSLAGGLVGVSVALALVEPLGMQGAALGTLAGFTVHALVVGVSAALRRKELMLAEPPGNPAEGAARK